MLKKRILGFFLLLLPTLALAGWLPFGGQGNGAGNFLPPSLAFQVTASLAGPHQAVVRFQPAQGYYLYRNKLTFALRGASKLAIAGVDLPKGQIKQDPYFGTLEVYHQPVEAEVRLTGAPAAIRAAQLVVGYQGCAERGICYPPQQKIIPLDASTGLAGSLADASGPAAPGGRIGALLSGGNIFWIMAGFFGFGLLLCFTPCMLPMVPILSGIIIGTHTGRRSRGLLLSGTYVLGMALTYTLAGVVAGLSGALVSTALQNAWVLGAFALVFVALSLSMFGVYELQLPAHWQTRLSERANRLPGGQTAGVFLMGALSALIVGPCVAAPLAGALLYIGQSGNVGLGGLALFSMALGMGAPLLLLGATEGALLPKAGHWMRGVKIFFGLLLLATAIWLVSPVLPARAVLLLWAALAGLAAWFVGLDARIWRQGRQGRLRLVAGLPLVLLGALWAVGAASGATDLLHPLAALSGARPAATGLQFEPVASSAALDRILQANRGRYVMLDFYADWCVSCKEMEHTTYQDAQVIRQLQPVLLLKADVTRNTADDQALLKRFHLFGPPGIIFFDRSGQPAGQPVIGTVSPAAFQQTLAQVFPGAED